jgi:hypothetical protein
MVADDRLAQRFNEMMMSRRASQSLSADPSQSVDRPMWFKPSSKKKMGELSLFATNLQIHRTFIYHVGQEQPVSFLTTT